MTLDQFLAVHDARLARNTERGMATFFCLQAAANCDDSSKRATWARIETWAKSSGYRVSRNQVDYVAVLRDAIDRKRNPQAK